jgi:hypothetical protein
MYNNAPNVDAMLKDLRECVQSLEEKPQIDTENIRALVAYALNSPSPEGAFSQLAQSAGIAGTELPEELAFINEVLEALPDEVANSLLIDFFNDLYV